MVGSHAKIRDLIQNKGNHELTNGEMKKKDDSRKVLAEVKRMGVRNWKELAENKKGGAFWRKRSKEQEHMMV